MTVDTWKGMGYIMVLFIAGLLSIPNMYYEAAEMDGAGFFSKIVSHYIAHAASHIDDYNRF